MNNNSLDVACITNYTDLNVLKSVIRSQGYPIGGGEFFKPLYFSVENLCGAIVPINSSASDLFSITGIREARKQFISALNYVNKKKPKVILLAASLKRLFGKKLEERIDKRGNASKNGLTLKELYPDILFTNGDNGTAILFSQEIINILRKMDIKKDKGKVAILGAGLLGVEAIKTLLNYNLSSHQIKVISSYNNQFKKDFGDLDLSFYDHIQDLDTTIDLMIACSHKRKISCEIANLLDLEYILDVAIPPAFSENEYMKCLHIVRQDAGNAYNKQLEYHFDPETIDLSEKNIFGCFAEAISLAANFQEEYKFLDFFVINDEAKQKVEIALKKTGFSLHPKPLCFSREL